MSSSKKSVLGPRQGQDDRKEEEEASSSTLAPAPTTTRDYKAGWDPSRSRQESQAATTTTRDVKADWDPGNRHQQVHEGVTEDATNVSGPRPGAVAVRGIESTASTATVTYGGNDSLEPAATMATIAASETTTTAPSSTNLLEATLVRTHSATVMAIAEDDNKDEHDATAQQQGKFFTKWTFGMLVLFVVIAVVVGVVVPVVNNKDGSGDEEEPFIVSTIGPTGAPADPSPTTSPTTSAFPSLTPTTIPTSSPTRIQCRITRDDSLPLLVPGSNPTFCVQRPLEITLTYLGATCADTASCTSVTRTCDDFNGGPDEDAGAAYVLAYDRDRLTLFEGVVPVGGDLTLSPEDASRVPADAIMEVYPVGEVRDESTLWQRQQLAISCAQPLLCPNLSGAFQLSGYTNEDNGQVSCPALVVFQYGLTIPTFLGVQQGVFSLNGVEYTALVQQGSPDGATVIALNNVRPTIAITYRATLSITAQPLGSDVTCVSVFEDDLVFSDIFGAVCL